MSIADAFESTADEIRADAYTAWAVRDSIDRIVQSETLYPDRDDLLRVAKDPMTPLFRGAAIGLVSGLVDCLEDGGRDE